MTRRPLTTAALGAALAVALCGGCSSGGAGDDERPAPSPTAPAPSGTGPYPTPSSPPPAEALPSHSVRPPHGGVRTPGDTDQKDATAVSRTALTVLMTYDTTVDTSRYQAGVRTAEAGWCTAAYAAQLRAAVPRAAPGAEWDEWARHRAYTRPQLTAADEAGRPADTSTAAYRQWSITLRPTGRDDWKAPPDAAGDLTAFVTLARGSASAPWRLAAVDVQ